MGWFDSEKKTSSESSLIPSWVNDYVEIPPRALEQIDDATHFSSDQCIVLGAICVTSLAVGFRAGRVRPIFRRLTNVADISSSDLGAASPWLKGRVITVSDGDTLRFLHVPSIFHSSQIDPDLKLSEQTLAIRMCTIDTPETAKFGKPEQPFGEDAKTHLSDLLLEKMCRVQLLTKDQYGRAVGQVQKLGWFGSKYADEYMLKAGMAEVYLGSGAVYGHRGKEAYLALQEKAKRSKTGVWSQKNRESAAEFKARTK